MRERKGYASSAIPAYASSAAAKPLGSRHHNPLPLLPLHHLTHAYISHKPTTTRKQKGSLKLELAPINLKILNKKTRIIFAVHTISAISTT